MASTRHYGMMGLSIQGVAQPFLNEFCANYDPLNPMSIGIALITATLTVIDYAKNNGKLRK